MHLEVLDADVRAMWDQCGFLKGYYLAGGTALALQIGHRKSIDLDFFSDAPIPRTLLATLEEELESKATVIVQKTTELTLRMNGVKMTFLHFPFPCIESKLETNIVPLATIRDIASMKAYALGRRQSLKDYGDLFTIISGKHVSLKEIIEDARTKFADGFSDRAFLRQLLAPEDLEEENIIWLVPEHSKEEMREFFRGEIEKVKEEGIR